MSKCKIKIVMVFILNLMLTTANAAQPQFYSESLKNLYELLPENCQQDTPFHCEEIVLEEIVKLNYQIDNGGVLVHIGYNFFSIADTLHSNRSIIQFLEREFLKWAISKNESDILLEYKRDKVSVKFNNNPISVKFLKNKKALIAILNETTGFNLKKNDNHYFAKIIDYAGNSIEFSFPNDEELISGMDKKKRDDFIANQLKNHKATNEKSYKIDTVNLKPVNDSIFIHSGNYYLIPTINNNFFVQKKDSELQIIVNSELINETFVNTMLGLSFMDYEYNIKHVKYGYEIENYIVCSNDFYDYFSTGYQRYFGVETCDKDSLCGTLYFQNNETGYIHFAYIKSTTDDLLKENSIEVMLRTNIPRSDLKNLFGEIEELIDIENEK